MSKTGHEWMQPANAANATGNAYGEVEFYRAPARRLREKLFTGFADAPPVSPAVVQRMERMIENLQADFHQWLGEDIETLRKILERMRNEPDSVRALMPEIAAMAVKLKGLGGTFDYPLVTTIASSLSAFVKRIKAPGALDLYVIETHLNSLVMVFRDNIKSDGGVAGQELIDDLGKLIAKADASRPAVADQKTQPAAGAPATEPVAPKKVSADRPRP